MTIMDSKVGLSVSWLCRGAPWKKVPAGTRESRKLDFILSKKAAGDSSPLLYLMFKTFGRWRPLDSILQTFTSLFLIQLIDVESVKTVLKRPSGQKAAIVVRREFRVALFMTESLLASRAAAAGSRIAAVWSTGMFIPLLGFILRASQLAKAPPSKNSR